MAEEFNSAPPCTEPPSPDCVFAALANYTGWRWRLLYSFLLLSCFFFLLAFFFPPQSFSFSFSVRLSHGCISYFTNHRNKRKDTPDKSTARVGHRPPNTWPLVFTTSTIFNIKECDLADPCKRKVNNGLTIITSYSSLSEIGLIAMLI